jgi:hypothetical protein
MTKDLVSSGIKGVPLMLKLSTMWKELSEKERAKYNLKCAKVSIVHDVPVKNIC